MMGLRSGGWIGRCGVIAFGCVALGAVAAWTAPVANGAVRVCTQSVSSGVLSAPNEAEAKRLAIEAWTRKAKLLGERFGAWNVAVSKVLKCVRAKSSGYDCLALATPCTIQQTPNPPTPRRKPPGGNNAAIDT